MSSIGMALIVRNSETTIKDCVESFIEQVQQCVLVRAGESADRTAGIIDALKERYPDKIEVYDFKWIDDFAAARNYSFSKLKTDWVCWCDADDIIYQPENMQELIKELPEDIGGIWFPYHYALDEFGNLTTVYERERLLKRANGWVWRGRLHETVSPLRQCRYVRTDRVIMVHKHMAGASRNDRNFRILNLMLKENPDDKRIWLYLGHQHFAARHYMKAAEWYLKFGIDNGALPLERYQALCYCAKALREMGDNSQSIEVAFKAVDLYPSYKDAYLELAHSYMRLGEIDKSIHFAMMSDVKDLMKEPPSIIFVNPLDYTYNKFALLAEGFLKKGEIDTALHFLHLAEEVRPVKDIKNNIMYVEGMKLRQKVSDSLKTLAIQLLKNREIVKLPHLLKSAPFWFRETDDYPQFKGGIEHYSNDLVSIPEVVPDGKNVTINVGKAFNLEKQLAELDKEYDKVTVVSPYPVGEKSNLINVLCQSDMEQLVMSSPGRHLINLHSDENRLWCEYDKKQPEGITVRFYIGQGFEAWNPKTIREIGCGGSETSAALLAHEFAQQGNLPVLYGMDNEIWDGVIYRDFRDFAPNHPCNLFISSRIPDLFNTPMPAVQKWLWVHDVCCWDRLTPDNASNIDAIIALSHWHAGHIKRCYPWLKDATEIDLDDQDKTYEDEWTAGVYEPDGKCSRLPRIIILGDAIDTARFENVVEERVAHRFVWCSSADRGLEEVLRMWKLIKAELPDATLKIFYGWEYFDSTLHIPAQRELKQRLLEGMEQEGIEFCGRIGQEELAHELAKADCMLYPPHPFRETYGIAFLEAQAAGVLVFYRQNGAMGETVGDRGIPLPMDLADEQIVKKVVNTLKDEKACGRMRERAREYALGRTWGRQAEKMLRLYESLSGEVVIGQNNSGNSDCAEPQRPDT